MRKSFRKFYSDSLRKQHRRKLASRKIVIGSAERPRICAVRSNKHIQIQVIDDAANSTLFSVQSFGKNAVAKSNNKESAKLIGAKVAEILKSKNISTAVFDRNGMLYTGVIAVLADSIRENGIQI